MFDVGFTEILVIAVVALVVIGPEKLPKTARTLGHLFGRLQRYVNDVKADINREIELDELRKLQQQVKTAASDFESSMTSAARDVEAGVHAVESDLNAAAQSEGAPSAPAEMLPLPPSAPPAAPAPEAATAGQSTTAPHADASRQATLPGFERG